MALRADDVDLGRDGALVERFQRGDVEAFSDLYRRYFERLERFCLQRVGDPHEAEELAQEAFARAYRALPAFAGERRFYPWVTVIASRLCIDSYRRRSRTEPCERVDLGVADDAFERVFAGVDHAQLAAAMARLVPRHQQVLDLRERHGWSISRIAEHLGVRPGTVEALLHRARLALRREFLALTEGDRLAASVPLVGAALHAISRRYQRARVRAAAWARKLSGLAPPVGAKAAAVALALGSTAVIAGAGWGGPSGVTPAAAAAPAHRRVTVAASAPVSTPAAASTPASRSTARARSPVASSPAAARYTTTYVAPLHTQMGNDPAIAQQAQSQPIHAEAAGASVGVNPYPLVTPARRVVAGLTPRVP